MELSTADKIFLFKDGYNSSSDDLSTLYDVMISKNDHACFLCIKLADKTNGAGTLKLIKPNTHVCYVEYFEQGNSPRHLHCPYVTRRSAGVASPFV